MKNYIFFPRLIAILGMFVGGILLSSSVHAQVATGTPLISSVLATSTASGTAAVISWVTDQPTDSVINYGVNAFYGASTSDSTLVTNHEQTLFGLIPGTEYHFQLMSTNASGTVATSSDQVFVTSSTSTGTSTATTTTGMPVISSVLATVMASGTAATISWTTDQPTDSFINYGVNIFYGAFASDTALVTDHSQILFGLIPDMTYHFQIVSTNASGTVATSSDQIFVTGTSTSTSTATGTPLISSVLATSTASGTAAVISWVTDQPTDSVINYGVNAFYGASTSDSTLVTNHEQTLFGLIPGTEYHFQLMSTNASGTVATSSDQVFVTSSTSTGTTSVTRRSSSGGSVGSRHRVEAASQVSTIGVFVFVSNLSKGMTSNEVIELQNKLRTFGLFNYAISTGYFGPITFEAVRAFQLLHNIPTTGFVGPLTRAALNML